MTTTLTPSSKKSLPKISNNVEESTNQFTYVAPLAFAGNDENLYRYVGNNPLNNVDPLGLLTEDTYTDVTWNDMPNDPPENAGYNAHIAWFYNVTGFKVSGEAVKIKDDCWKVTLTAGSDVKVKVKINKEESWHHKKEETDALLKHEQLHIWMAEHNAKIAESKIKQLTASGCGKTQPEATNDAWKKIRDQKNTILRKMNAISDSVIESSMNKDGLYDKETSHGTIPDKQKYWEDNFKSIIDGKWEK